MINSGLSMDIGLPQSLNAARWKENTPSLTSKAAALSLKTPITGGWKLDHLIGDFFACAPHNGCQNAVAITTFLPS